MKAALLRAFAEPLEIAEVAEPKPAADETVIRVRTVGLCGTDLKITGGAFAATTPLPLVPGHEVAGEVVGDAGDLRPGQRVACYIYDPCGRCRWCGSGQPTLCPHSRRIGFERDGGLAEYIAVPMRNLLPFADSLPFEAAGVTMDAVATPWRALRSRAALEAGETIAIVGAGGLGLNGIQVAVAVGARVAALDPVESHREEALALGAELAVPPEEAGRVRDWSDGGVDVALEAAGVRAAFDTAVACLRPGGRLVACGYYPGLEYGLDSMGLVLGEITVLGSRASSLEDARAALQAVEEGRVRPTIAERLPLEAVNEALARLRARDVLGRFVVEL